MKSIKFRDHLYFQLKRTAPDSEIYNIIKIKTYKVCKGSLLQLPMREIETRSQEYVENDTRNYMQVKYKKKSISEIQINDRNISDKNDITNSFNKIFIDIGPNVALKWF